MNFPTISQVAHKSKKYSVLSQLFDYPITEYERESIRKLDPFNPPKVLDSDTDFKFAIQSIMRELWKPPQKVEGGIKLHGKLEFVKKFINPVTKDIECVYTFTDPRSFVQEEHSNTTYIRTPIQGAHPSGIYAEIDIYLKNQDSNNLSFIENADILPKKNFLEAISPPFLDYEKLQKIIAKQFIFEVESPLISVSENFSLSNQDMLQLSKVAGEGFGNQNKGTLSCNLVYVPRGTGSTDLEILDEVLSRLTFSRKTKTFMTLDVVHLGDKSKFFGLLNSQNKDLELTQYPDYYGGNVGFAMNALDVKEKRELGEELETQGSKICNDFVNPIGHIKIAPKSYIKTTLKNNPTMLYGSRFINLMARLLPIETSVKLVEKNSPSSLRLASVLNKYQEAVYHIGDADIFPHLKLKEEDVVRAKTVQRKNSKEVSDFINKGI